MKTAPIRPARIDFGSSPGAAPQAPDYGDLYHPRVGAGPQARHVFLQGNGLPGRWAGRSDFVILETGFGLGNNFLATWQAWRDDPARCERLFFVSIERHPPRHEDLQHAHADGPQHALAAELLRAWPPLTPNLHLLRFDRGRVQLLLAWGDVALLLPGLQLQADAFFLDGFAPPRNPEMWQDRVLKALGRKAAPGATLATWTVARAVREGLATAGFEVALGAGIGGKRDITTARYAPRHAARAPSSSARPDTALVIGAGLAGAAAAQALAGLGVEVTVLDRHAQPASATSGNPAGLFHGTLDPDDSVYARLFRSAALHAARIYGPACLDDTGLGRVQGLLRLDTQPGGIDRMRELLLRQGLPADWVQALDAQAASAMAGLPLSSPAWHYPTGGWLSPPRWVRQVLAEPGVRHRAQVEVDHIVRAGGLWQALDAGGAVLAQAPCLVLACAADAARLLHPWHAQDWPLSTTGGQVSWWSGPQTAAPALPVAGDGYAIPLPDGGLLCGATRRVDSADAAGRDLPLRSEDQAQNIERLQRLLGITAPPDADSVHGRAGWRLHTDDRLPIAGALPLREMPPGQRMDQARLLPREPGLFVLTALGARGLSLAPLLGQLIAAQATGTPWPLEQDLADAVDPARWRVRAARRAAGADQPG